MDRLRHKSKKTDYQKEYQKQNLNPTDKETD